METDKILAVVNQLTVSKEERQLTEWKPCVTGEEKEFTKALQYNPINKSTVDELKQVLKLVMLKVGIRANNLPNDVEKAVLIEHIINQYGKHTPAEIRLAFDMAMAGKLDLEDKEVVCYENFSCLYFSKIMNAYRVWARETFNQLKMENKSPEPEIENIDMIEWVESYRGKPDIKIDLLPLCFYDFLSETVLTVTTEMKFTYLAKGVASVKAELLAALPDCKTNDALIEWKEFERMEKEGFTGKLKTLVQNRSKRLIVYDYLNF